MRKGARGSVCWGAAEEPLRASLVSRHGSVVLARLIRTELSMRVLVVEDEVRLAEMLRRGLVADGFTVEVEHDGDNGFHSVATGEFDALVLDIMLPGKHGYDIVRDLRAQGVWTPILMLSAKDGEYDLADAFDLGDRKSTRLNSSH